MKTVLTLQSSSMLFIGSVNLYKNRAVEVDSNDLHEKDIRVLNRVIRSGSVHSSEGLFEEPTEEVKIEAIAEAVVIETKEEVAPEIVEAPIAKQEEAKAEEVVTPAKKNKQTAKTKTTTKKSD